MSRCGPGDLLGEMSFLTGQPASADTVVAADAVLLEIEQDQLSSLIHASVDLGFSVNTMISRNLVSKLDKQSRRGVVPVTTPDPDTPIVL